MLLTLTPVLAGAAEAGKARPVAWLALRSYQRLEQRLREISTMAKTPGLADMMLGMVQLQLAGLGGLDRQRHIGVVVPTVSVSDKPPLAVVIPYTERDAMLQTLRSFFPQTIVENGEKLSLQGGPIPAFGQVDAQASVLIVSTAPEAVQGFDVTLPADLFGTQEGGPDVVLRVDVDAVQQQLDVAWKSLLAGMEQFWQAALQKAAEKQGLSSTDKEAMTASLALTQKGMRQFLDDLLLGESRLTLAPTGWVFDLETRMRSASASAAFINAQAGHMSRAAQFFTPGALLRVVENLRMTDTLRQEMLALLPASRQMLEAKLAAMPALSQGQRDAGMQAIATYLKLAEQWYAQKEIELAVEVRIQESTGPEVTGWGPFPGSASAVQSPVKPPPTTHTSALASPSRRGACSPETPAASSSHHGGNPGRTLGVAAPTATSSHASVLDAARSLARGKGSGLRAADGRQRRAQQVHGRPEDEREDRQVGEEQRDGRPGDRFGRRSCRPGHEKNAIRARDEQEGGFERARPERRVADEQPESEQRRAHRVGECDRVRVQSDHSASSSPKTCSAQSGQTTVTRDSRPRVAVT